jgi:hypothetical protein
VLHICAGSCTHFSRAGFKPQSSCSLPTEQLGLYLWATSAPL